LLAVLLLHLNEVVSRDRLIDELWGARPPATADKAVQGYVWRLRRALAGAGTAAIETASGGYVLRAAGEQVDAARFERLLDDGRARQAAGEADAAAQRFHEALELWRGPALAGLAFESHARSEVERLDELRLAARIDLNDCKLALGRHEPLVPELEALVEQHPFRERLAGQLMLALYRSGRQADALDVYRRTRESLVSELGIEPGTALRELEAAILRQDAGLAPPAAPVVIEPPAAQPQPPSGERRKTVTVLFSDIVGSTELGDSADPEAVRQVLTRWYDEMRDAIERHGGTIEKFAGDEVMAVFGVPVLHEDDALRAVRAAAEMQARLDSLNAELEAGRGIRVEARTGVNTGEVVAGDASSGQSFVTGAAVNLARRLEQAAGPGEILIGERTYRLLEHAVTAERLAPFAVKGRREPVAALRLERVDTVARPRARGLDAPMVGRERERRLLAGALERVRSERSVHLFTILGAAGVGKSRLAADFLDSLDGPVVLRGRCLSYGEGITYWPVVEILKQLGGVGDLPSDPLARSALLQVLGEESGGPASTDEIAWAFRKLVEALAATGGVAVLFDDLHWGEPTLLDLVEHVSDLSREHPILLVCLARPELLERRPGWAGGKLNATTVLLEPLADEEADNLIARLLGGRPMALERRERIRSAAEGNPLFIEEMVALVRSGGNGEPAVPPTIQALLAARLDQLPVDERDVLARGSVEGKVFHRGAVQVLAPVGADLPACLTRLIRKELLRPDRTLFAGDDAFRFRHQLIRDAAYDALPKATRAELHERLAEWLEERTTELGDADEIVGYHYEQAARFRVELGVDARAGELAARAGRRLAAAAVRAVERNDARAAIPLLRRALSLLPEEERTFDLRLELARNLFVAGRTPDGIAVAEEALVAAARHGDRVAEHRARIHLARLRSGAEPEGAAEQIRAAATAALPVFEAAGDHVALHDAWSAIEDVEFRLCRYQACAEAAERSLEHAQLSGDPLRVTSSLGSRLGAHFWGPAPVEQVLELLERDDHGLERGHVWARLALAMLQAMLGRFDTARAQIDVARAIGNNRGRVFSVATSYEASWIVETLAGDDVAAEREARLGCELFESIGERGSLSTIAGRLALTLASLGRFDEAEHWAAACEETSASDDVANLLLLPRVRARLLAGRGELEAAERLADEAVAVAAGTDMLNERGDALVDLAGVLLLAGRTGHATKALEQALTLYARKGNVAMAARTRARLEQLPQALPAG
jgi:class 3 adenylate cyclase